ncbi:DUF6279 family lipoprotein [Rhodocyclaceae bacterium SMB388]
MRIRSVFLVICVSTLLAACGTVRYVYGQLDWIVPWYVRDYVRLDRDQRALLDMRLGERIAWHCTAELPAYAVFLRELDADLAAHRVDVDSLDRHVSRIEVFVRTLSEAIVPDLTELLGQLRDDQIEHLAARLEVRNEDMREKFLDGSPDELHAARVERMEKRLRRWFGQLDAGQRDLIERWSLELDPVTEAWLSNRIVWQQRFLTALELREERDLFLQRVSELLLDADAHTSEEHQASVATNRRLTLQLISDLHRDASPSQRARLGRELDSLASQLEGLSCSRPA